MHTEPGASSASVVVIDSRVDKIILIKSDKSWKLPGGFVPRGMLPMQYVAQYVYGEFTPNHVAEFKLLAILGWEGVHGYDFVYTTNTGQVGNVIQLPPQTEHQLFSLQEIFASGFPITGQEKQKIGAWQKCLHTAKVFEGLSHQIKGVTIGTTVVPI